MNILNKYTEAIKALNEAENATSHASDDDDYDIVIAFHTNYTKPTFSVFCQDDKLPNGDIQSVTVEIRKSQGSNKYLLTIIHKADSISDTKAKRLLAQANKRLHSEIKQETK